MGLIRFLLACGVVLVHTGGIHGYSPLGSNLAVQCFYIISGFYMAFILNEKYTGKNSLFIFYTNRALKIYPLYWTVLVLRVIWGFIVFRLGYPGTLDHYSENWPLSGGTLCFLILSNLLIVGLDWYFFLGIKSDGTMFFSKTAMSESSKVYDMAFNFMAWTISIELIFYLFAPFIVRKNIKYIIIILLVSLLIRLLIIENNMDIAPWNYMFLPSQVMFFMAGIISYRIYVYLNSHPIKSTSVEFAIFFFFSTLILLYYQFFEDTYIKQLFLFVSATISIPIIFKLTKSFKFDQWLGNLSYPIYVTQILFVKILPAKSIPKIIDLGFTTLVLTIILSITLDRIITKPIEYLRQKRALALKNQQ